MERIRVDFNRRGRDGNLVSSVKRSSGPVSVGDIVDVYQPGEADMDGRATVVSVADDGRLELAEMLQTTFSFRPLNAPLWNPFPATAVSASPSAPYYDPQRISA